jgi:hypothetical protein
VPPAQQQQHWQNCVALGDPAHEAMWRQGQRSPCFCCLVSVVLALILAARSCEAAGASVSLRARWQGTPYLLEAAEFLVRVQAAWLLPGCERGPSSSRT